MVLTSTNGTDSIGNSVVLSNYTMWLMIAWTTHTDTSCLLVVWTHNIDTKHTLNWHIVIVYIRDENIETKNENVKQL